MLIRMELEWDEEKARQNKLKQRERRRAMNEKSTGTVVYELDLDKLPPLSEEQHLQVQALQTMQDAEIDYSDIPKTAPGTRWQRPGKPVNAEGPEVVALDADLLHYFESGGRADAAKVNAVLREYVGLHPKSC